MTICAGGTPAPPDVALLQGGVVIVGLYSERDAELVLQSPIERDLAVLQPRLELAHFRIRKDAALNELPLDIHADLGEELSCLAEARCVQFRGNALRREAINGKVITGTGKVDIVVSNSTKVAVTGNSVEGAADISSGNTGVTASGNAVEQ